jgi:hypothetical protein
MGIRPDTKLALLIYASPGMGKTSIAGSLDRLTQKFDGKRTLYIPVEASELGGAATIRKLNLPMFRPDTFSELDKALGELRNDKTFGGIVLDSATEMVNQYIKSEALKYPPKENFATRGAGVPTRSDYQVIGELTSQIFRKLMLMTTHEKPEYRKHLIITATTKEIEDDSGRVAWRGPALPGRMAAEAAAMFQICATIKVKTEILEKKRIVSRYLCTSTDGLEAVKDRFEVFPPEVKICRTYTNGGDGEDLCSLWEKYWIPQLEPRPI